MQQLPRREKPIGAMPGVSDPLRSGRIGASMRVGINCAQVNATVVGGINTYTMGLLEGFANVGNGHRFRVYASQANHYLFEQFRKRDNFDVLVVDDRLLGAKSCACRAALLSWSKDFYKFTSNF